VCSWCRRYASRIRFLRHAVVETPDMHKENDPCSLSPDARERLKKTLASSAKRPPGDL
jgi:hypothetical protein